MPVPSQGHCGFPSFPVVNWFCLFVDLWVLPFPWEECSVFGYFVITLIHIMLDWVQIAWAGFELATWVVIGTDYIGQVVYYHKMKTKNTTLREQFQTKNSRNEDKMDSSNTHNILFIYFSCLVTPLSLVETKTKWIHLTHIIYYLSTSPVWCSLWAS